MPETKTNNVLIDSSGFSLIELLIAMAVASMIMAAVASAYWVQIQTSRGQQLVVDMQQNMRSGLFFLQRDILMAGHDDNPNDALNATITTANANALTLQFIDDTNTRNTVAYTLYDAGGDGDIDIGRSVNGGLRNAIAENIETLEYFYTLADGTQTLAPATQNDRDDIRSVGISIIFRSAAETGEPNNITYTALSGATAGPFNDGFARQLVTVNIKCRNMN